MRVRLAAFFLLLAVGCSGAAVPPSARPPAASPPDAPTAPCREVWAGTPPERWAFDFNETYDHYRKRLPRRHCLKRWTALIYMAADYTDLTPEAYRDLAEMEVPFEDPAISAASTVDADVVVELDLRSPEGVRRLHLFSAPTAPGPEEIQSPVVGQRQQEDVPPAKSLRDFLDWGVSSYPAERYLVIVWGHGLGWRPAQPDGAPVQWAPYSLDGGLAFDESQGTVIDTPSLRQALEAASPLAVYVSDACLMQSVEVVSELTPVARYVVGSEQVEDYLGLPYRLIMPRVNGTLPLPFTPVRCAEKDAACRVAHLLPELQPEAFPPGAKGLETFTLSALDARAFDEEVIAAARRLSFAIVAWLKEDPLNKIDLLELLEVQDRGGGGIPGFLGGNRDFGVFLAGLSRLTPLKTPAALALSDAVASMRRTLEHPVISARFGSSYDEPEHEGKLGVSVWLPHNAEEYRRAPRFASSPFARAEMQIWLTELFTQEP